MMEVQQNNEAQNLNIPQGEAVKQVRTRRTDNGPAVLSHMAHFVCLTRRVQRVNLLNDLVEYASGTPMTLDPLPSVAATKCLPMAQRNAFFAQVAQLPPAAQLRLERAAERVTLLGDEFGALAVLDVLDSRDPEDANLLASSSDKLSRALYLFLKQDRRFDHAEARQQQLAHTHSEKYASHYLGPKGVQPKLDPVTQGALRARLSALFPQVKAEDMVMDCFVRRDRHDWHDRPDTSGRGETEPIENPIRIYTLNATFNGAHVHFQQVQDGEVRDHDELAVTQVQYCWQPDKGTLVVYCDDKTTRSELAMIFRDVVLGGSADFGSMPIREFDLTGFSTPAMVQRIQTQRIQGIDSISIQHLVLAKPQSRHMLVRGKEFARVIQSDLRIRRHRFDERDVYQIASEDLALDDLSDYRILGVKLSIRLALQSYRPAHATTVEITLPNGFGDRSKTEEDTEIILSQLTRLGCVRQY